MTQLAVSEELASNLLAKAAKNACTPEVLIESMLLQLENDEALVDSALTPALEHRMLTDLKADRGTFTTSEDVDGVFDKLFHELESR